MSFYNVNHAIRTHECPSTAVRLVGTHRYVHCKPFIPSLSTPAGPGGQIYYYHAQTQESTYVRPIPAFPIMPAVQSELPKKKEKPLVKTPIPGTDWIRVKTTEGNVFYSHKVKKKSVWTVPEEIGDAVEALEQDERDREGNAAQAAVDKAAEQAREGERELSQEIERIKGEVQEMVKRKAEDIVPIDELVITKKSKIEDEDEGDESDESEEEEWQREAVVQLAAEAEAEKKRLEEEAERERRESEVEVKRLQAAQLNMPARVDLSLDEAKALFKVSVEAYGHTV